MSPSNHPTTPLASAKVNHDELKVELIEPDTMPAMVRIVWPEKSSMIDPKRFGDTAAALVRIFSEAHVTLGRIKARRSL